MVGGGGVGFQLGVQAGAGVGSGAGVHVGGEIGAGGGVVTARGADFFRAGAFLVAIFFFAVTLLAEDAVFFLPGFFFAIVFRATDFFLAGAFFLDDFLAVFILAIASSPCCWSSRPAQPAT
jgi:hypothetical protein